MRSVCTTPTAPDDTKMLAYSPPREGVVDAAPLGEVVAVLGARLGRELLLAGACWRIQRHKGLSVACVCEREREESNKTYA